MGSSDVIFLGSVLAPRRNGQSCKIFKRSKNREDNSDFEEFLTKSSSLIRSTVRKRIARRARTRRRRCRRHRRRRRRHRRQSVNHISFEQHWSSWSELVA